MWPLLILSTASNFTAITTVRGHNHGHERCSWICLRLIAKWPQVAMLLPQGPREGPRLMVLTMVRGSPRGDALGVWALCHLEGDMTTRRAVERRVEEEIANDEEVPPQGPQKPQISQAPNNEPSVSLCSVSLGDIVLLRETIRRNADCSFHRLFYLAPSRLSALEQRAECVPSANFQACLAMLRLQLLRSFQPFCSILPLSVHASTKTSNT
uniref:Uncharacterized protein n=1 Tax=Solanum tuberosum TaxID=4113 RepID=M1E0B1_SOLTU